MSGNLKDFENNVETVSSKVWAFVKVNTLPLFAGLILGYLFGLVTG